MFLTSFVGPEAKEFYLTLSGDSTLASDEEDS